MNVKEAVLPPEPNVRPASAAKQVKHPQQAGKREAPPASSTKARLLTNAARPAVRRRAVPLRSEVTRKAARLRSVVRPASKKAARQNNKKALSIRAVAVRKANTTVATPGPKTSRTGT